MSFFARATWPADHRDEIVAGALVAAVIVVLGYASGIGAPAPTDLDSAAPPAAGAPSAVRTPTSGSSVGPGGTAGDTGAGSAGDSWAGGSGAGIPVTGNASSGMHGSHGTGGGDSEHGPMPEPSESAPGTPRPTPSPTSSGSCGEGEVRLVQPLLNGVLAPATGLLDSLLKDGSGATASPMPSSSPSSSDVSSLCVGVAPSPSVIPEVLP